MTNTFGKTARLNFLKEIVSHEEEGLQHVLKDQELLQIFKQFLDEEHSSENLMFLLEAEIFKVNSVH